MPRTAITDPDRFPVAVPALLACVAWGASACRAPEPEPEPVSPAAAHAVESEELEEVMRYLELLDEELLPQELDPRREDQRQRDRIVDLAVAVARSAGDIPSVLEGTALPAPLREEFVGLATELEAGARSLASAARGRDDALLAERLTTMRRSCTACHTRFRILPAVR